MIMGIFPSISKTLTLRLIYTIIITNQGERELLFGFKFNCIRCVIVITIVLIQTTYLLFKRNPLFVIIYFDSLYAFLLETKTLFPYFVELRGTRFKK